MKYLDLVRLVSDNKELNRNGIYKGMVGSIIDAEIRTGSFHVLFTDQRLLDKNFKITEDNIFDLCDDISYPIDIEMLELIKDFGATDEQILEDLPSNDPNWWCKVENGYIYNLKGEKKNKIPYDYNS